MALHDLRMALRLLWKDRGFAAATSATLAVCAAANVALFSVVHHVLLRPLPIPESDRILLMVNDYPKLNSGGGTTSAVPDYFDRLRETTVFEEQALYAWGSQGVDQNGNPTRVPMMFVTPSFFRLVRVPVQLGRTFT